MSSYLRNVTDIRILFLAKLGYNMIVRTNSLTG